MYKNSLFVKISVVFLLLFWGGKSYSQIGKEFWFDVPEVNRGHVSSTYNFHVYLHVSALKDPANVVIELPAEPGFTPITFTVPAGTKKRIELTDAYSNTSNFTNINSPMSLFYNAYRWGNYTATPVADRPKYIENLLEWSESDANPTNPSYINRTNKGVRMYSDKDIMAYIEIGVGWNMDIIALKGANALGKKFFVPFQTDLPTATSGGAGNYATMNCPPYHSFNIVATQPSTVVRITVPLPIWLKQGTQVGVNNGRYLNAGTYEITLNRGQSSIITPYAVNNNNTAGYQVAWATNTRLAGAKVEVVSGGDIVVLTRDDITYGPNPDYVADQLVPIDYAGTDFGVIRGVMSATTKNEFIYIIGTEPATTVWVSGHGQKTITESETWSVRIDAASDNGVMVHSDKKVFVFHMSGTGSGGSDQKAGAIIPALPNDGICIGSQNVVFSRTKASPYVFYLNVLAWDKNSDPLTSAIGNFVLQKEGPTGFVAVSPTSDEKKLEDYLNNSSNWNTFSLPVGVPSSPVQKWKYVQINTDAIGANIASGTVSYRLINNNNVFHLGVLNGAAGSDAFYGYFSDFKSYVAQAYAGGDPSNPIAIMPVCYSQTTQLNATGGLTYSWTPTDFLSNPNIENPLVVNPTSSRTYTATVSGVCDLTSTTSVTVEVSPPINPTLTPSTNYVCGSSSVTFTAGSLENVTKLKWYVKAPGDLDFPATPVRTDIISGIAPVDYSHTFVYPPSGDGINPAEYTLRLVASNDGCPVILESVIKVYPAVDVNPTLSFGNPNGCSPLTISFTAGAGGIAGSYYRWEFGDGSSSNINNPTHTYYNYSHINSADYTASVTITDRHNVCTVTKTVDINVKPLVDAHFVIDPVAGCGPSVTFKATSDSRFPSGTSFQWYVDGVLKVIGGIPFTGTVLNQGFLHSGATSEDAEPHVIRLELSAGGCSDSHNNTVYVYPKAEIGTVTVTPLVGNDPKCSPLNVSFDATGIKNATSYYWQVKEMPAGAVQNVGSGTIPVTTTTLQLPSYTFINTSNVSKIYQVSLFVNNKWGCTVSKSASITINPYVEAIAVADKEEGCPDIVTGNFRVNLTNASIMPTGGRFQWTIDGVARGWNIAVPFVDFQNNTAAQVSKVIQLTVENSAGCVSNDLVTIRVNPRVTASFTATVDGALINSSSTLCSPVVVDFQGTYTNATTYSWQFGDLGASTDPNTTFILYNTGNTPKTVVVTLTASNPSGCLATATVTYTIQPEIKADFSLSNSASCVPFSFNVAAPPSAATYSWEVLRGATPFFSGTGNTPPPIDVLENKTGATEVYKVTLTASNGVCTATSPAKLVLAYPEVEAKWNLSDVIPASCSPFNLNITNLSTLYSSAPASPVLTDVLWEITDGAAFNVTSINPNLTQQLVSLGYELPKNYTLKLTARSADGCIDNKTSPVVVNPPVNAAFNASVIDACTPMRIQFTDISQVKTGTPYIWNWDGGTVVSQSGQNYVIDYTNPDPELTVAKTVTLNLTNEYGCFGSASYPFTVNPRVVAALAPSTDNVCAPDDIIFQNNSTGGTLSFKWNYGDGSEEVVNHRNNVTHRYDNKTANPLIRTVSLTATNSIGCVNATPATIPVTIFPEIVPDFTFTIDSICTPVKVTIANSTLNGTNFQWNFTPSAGTPIVVNNLKTDSPFSQMLGNTLPNADVTYTVGLTASTNHGVRTCSRVATTKTVTVSPELLQNFVPAPLAVCSDLPINFDNQSSGGTLNYTWDFNDGQSGASVGFDDVQHIFINRDPASITRNVSVTAINPKGCTRKQIIPVIVHPKVEAGFVFAQQSQCTPFNLDISNTSLNGNKYFWTTFYNGSAVTKTSNQLTHPFDNATLNDILTDTIKMVSRDTITGCSDSIKQTIVIYPRVVSQFDVDKLAGCNPLTVNFTNSSSGLASYIWDFGDGGASAETTPTGRTFSHVHKDQSQVFKVRLTATNKFGCNSKDSTEITVYPLVKTEFQWNKFEGCTPLTVDLNNSSVSPLYKYRWEFGDGTPNVYTEQPTSHTFINSTNNLPVVLNPTITLRTSYVNDSTCIDSMKLPIKVYPHIYPDFITNFQGCHPHNVTITNQTVSVNNLTDTYFWNLGNGVNSLDVNPAIQYINTSKTKDSTFTVKLRAVSIYGCKDSISHNIIVHPRPFASMELTGDYISCPPFPVEIQNNSIGTNLTNIFDFGDGSDSTTTSMANMNHTFRNLNSSNTEPYQIQLKTVTEFGCDDSISQTVYVYPEVVAKFNANPGWAACNPFEVTLQNTSTNAYYYRWDFDNGVTSSFPSPKHRFVNLTENDKVFNVSLSATSEFDCFHDTIQPVTVWATPVAHIALDPPLKVFPDATFDVLNQSIPAADNWTYSWTFDDNTFSTLKNPGSHTYLSWGPKSKDYKYTVSLVVNSPHCKDSTSSFIYLLPPSPIPFFTSNIDSACSPMEVHFINATQYAESFFWEFGDGTTSVEPEPVHTYTQPGYYTVKLTVNGDGGQRFYYKIFRVYQNPVADFQVYPVRVMLPDATVHAFNTSTSFSRCLWDMGDGFQTDTRDPIHTYTKIGEFRIALWAYMEYMNNNGDVIATCIDSISKFPAVWVEGSGLLKFPNAFKPNTVSNGGVYDDMDYKNEVFHPYHYGVVDYKLMIFSRWGEQVFTSTDVKVGWDGFINGKLAEQGVYMWRAIGKFTNGKTFDMKGSVTLLR